MVSHLTSRVARDISKLRRKTQITGPVGYLGLNDPNRKTAFFQKYLLPHIREIANHLRVIYKKKIQSMVTYFTVSVWG